jgi:hypothetical protein
MGWWKKVREAWAAMATLVSTLARRIQQLEQEVKGLRQQLQELQGRLTQDSHNSHRPPSADGLSKPHPNQKYFKTYEHIYWRNHHT